MQSQDFSKQPTISENLSFLEREAIMAASAGDHSGVTAKPVGFWSKNTYWSSASSSSTPLFSIPEVTKNSSELVKPWKMLEMKRNSLAAQKVS